MLLADSMVPALRQRNSVDEEITIGARKRGIRVPLRDMVDRGLEMLRQLHAERQ